MTENARRRSGPIYLRVVTPESRATPRIPQFEPKDPVAERIRSLTNRLRDPRYYTDQTGEERLVAHTLGRGILDLVESEPVPHYASLHNELKALKGYDPFMYLRVATLLTIVQAEKLKERAEREPVIPKQRSDNIPDYGYADHKRELEEPTP